MNYQRVTQWASGPASIFAGLIAAKLVTNTSFLGQAGLGRNQVAHAIVDAVTFAIGALVTYAAHHKTLDNINKVLTTFGTHNPTPSLVADTATEAKLRAQLTNAGIKPEA